MKIKLAVRKTKNQVHPTTESQKFLELAYSVTLELRVKEKWLNQESEEVLQSINCEKLFQKQFEFY